MGEKRTPSNGYAALDVSPTSLPCLKDVRDDLICRARRESGRSITLRFVTISARAAAELSARTPPLYAQITTCCGQISAREKTSRGEPVGNCHPGVSRRNRAWPAHRGHLRAGRSVQHASIQSG